jgi:TfoX/Sxy family transcriptional regulator of competence genes
MRRRTAGNEAIHVEAELSQRLRNALALRKGVTEQKMFGGVCFLLNGNMLCGSSKRGFMFRVGKERHAEALSRPGASPMEMNGRRYEGFIRVDPSLCTNRQLPDWVALAHAHVALLPPKKRPDRDVRRPS